MPAQPRRRIGPGFTLIEVMIALAIVSIALLAIMHGISAATTNQGMLRERELALMAAGNRLAELQLAARSPGLQRAACPQGHLKFECVQRLARADHGGYQATVEVYTVDDGPPRRVAILSARIGNPLP